MHEYNISRIITKFRQYFDFLTHPTIHTALQDTPWKLSLARRNLQAVLQTCYQSGELQSGVEIFLGFMEHLFKTWKGFSILMGIFDLHNAIILWDWGCLSHWDDLTHRTKVASITEDASMTPWVCIMVPHLANMVSQGWLSFLRQFPILQSA